jgi:hypothetical protein
LPTADSRTDILTLLTGLEAGEDGVGALVGALEEGDAPGAEELAAVALHVGAALVAPNAV